MGLIERLVDLVVASDVPLNRAAIVAAVDSARAVEAPLAPFGVSEAVADELVGLGPIEPLLRDGAVSDVFVNGPDEVWVERHGELHRVPVQFSDEAAVLAAVERVIAPLGLRIDRASPVVDARLPDGSRIHAVMAPVAVDGPIVAVRRFTEAVVDLDGLVDAGGIATRGRDLLAAAVLERRNILVSGGTGAGKTTLLNILSRVIPPNERVVTVEDAAELNLAGHVVRLEARPPNTEGAGEIGLRDLVRHALRLRPDRIIVGEVRGSEALDMIQAMSTGHDGSMSTVHANGSEEALWRVETLALSGDARVSPETVRRQLRASLDLVVHVVRRRGERIVEHIARLAADRLETVYEC